MLKLTCIILLILLGITVCLVLIAVFNKKEEAKVINLDEWEERTRGEIEMKGGIK